MPSGKFSIMYSFGVGIYFLGPPCTHTHQSCFISFNCCRPWCELLGWCSLDVVCDCDVLNYAVVSRSWCGFITSLAVYTEEWRTQYCTDIYVYESYCQLHIFL